MASKKPLVLNTDGTIEQLQAGDTLNAAISEVDIVSMVADATITIGNPVYASAAGHCNKAQANAAATSRIVGLAAEGITSAASGSIQTDGVLTLTTGQWDAIAGTTGGLTYGTDYFLSEATAGYITETAPTTGYVTKVGRGLSTTELDINVSAVIKL